jgi:hypothetical protein
MGQRGRRGVLAGDVVVNPETLWVKGSEETIRRKTRMVVVRVDAARGLLDVRLPNGLSHRLAQEDLAFVSRPVAPRPEA